jgi:hypothetical protein
VSTHADMLEIEFAPELRSKGFDMRKGIDDEGNVLRAILPSTGIAERLAQGAAEAAIGNGVGVRRMNAYISVASPVFAQAGVRVFGCQCTVGEENDRKPPYRSWIIDFYWDVFIARWIVQHNVLDRKYLVWPHSRAVLAPDCA